MTPVHGSTPRGPYRTVGTIVVEIDRDAETMEEAAERTRANVRDLTARLLRKQARARRVAEVA